MNSTLRDVDGAIFEPGDRAALLCEFVEVRDGIALVRILNSDMELAVSVSGDEVSGFIVASELRRLRIIAPPPAPAPAEEAPCRTV